MAEEILNTKELLMKLEESLDDYMQIMTTFKQFLEEHGLEEEFKRFVNERGQKKTEIGRQNDEASVPAASREAEDGYVPIMIMGDTLHRTNDEYGNIEWVARFYRTDDASIVDGEVEEFDAHYNPRLDSVYMTARGTATAGDIDPMYLNREEIVEVKRQIGWAAVTFGITTLQGSEKLPYYVRKQEALDIPIAVFQYSKIMELFGRDMTRSVLDYADRIVTRVYRTPEKHAIEELRSDMAQLIEGSGKGADDPDIKAAKDFMEWAENAHKEIREDKHGEIKPDPNLEDKSEERDKPKKQGKSL